MKIKRDKKYEQEILNKIIDTYLSNRRKATPKKWHVSDLLFPRFGYFARTDKKYKPTREDIGFFMTGEAFHRFLQKVLGVEKSELEGEYLNIIGTCDFLGDDDLTEIKTSRKWTVPSMPQDHYVEQAAEYCVIFHKTKARILVIYPTSGRKWNGKQSSTVEIAVWTVTFSPADLKATKRHMKEIGSLLDEALEERDHTILPLCPSWKCGREWKGEITTCPFYDRCRPKNLYPLDELESYLKRSKHGKPKVRSRSGFRA